MAAYEARRPSAAGRADLVRAPARSMRAALRGIRARRGGGWARRSPGARPTELVSAHRLVLSRWRPRMPWLGDADAAAGAAAELDRLPPHPFVASEHEMGRAWASAVAGDLPGARRCLAPPPRRPPPAATGCRRRGWLHDVARLGDPSAVAGRLAELAGESEGGLVTAYADHAAGPDGGCARRRDRPLSKPWAPCCWPRRSRPRRPRPTSAIGDRRLLGPRRPSVGAGPSVRGGPDAGPDRSVVVVPLTARERDIAAPLRRATPASEIAERLFLSVRTVDNHLQNVYRSSGSPGDASCRPRWPDLDVSSSADGPWPPTASSPAVRL